VFGQNTVATCQRGCLAPLARLVLVDLWQPSQNACEYCRLPQRFAILPFQIDHIIAQRYHGPTANDNLSLCYYNDD